MLMITDHNIFFSRVGKVNIGILRKPELEANYFKKNCLYDDLQFSFSKDPRRVHFEC